MLINVQRSTRDGTLVADAWWQIPDGPIAGYIKWWRRGDDLRLGDVEVRSEWRRRGIARAMIAAVEAREGAVMRSSGSFTPDGLAALAAHLPPLPGTSAQANTAPMSFVADWDSMRPLFPVRG